MNVENNKDDGGFRTCHHLTKLVPSLTGTRIDVNYGTKEALDETLQRNFRTTSM